MSKHQSSNIEVTWDQVTAFRLARHHLLERASKRDLLSVADNMVGSQAQLLSAAQISLGTRVGGLHSKDVEEAIARRKLIKAACMRRTLFLVPAKHLAIYVRGSAKRADKGINWTRSKGVSERVIDKSIHATLDVLGEPLTRSEIAERVSRKMGVIKQDVHGGGWGSRGKVAAVPVDHLTFPVVDLLHLVGARGVVCYGPYRDNEPTFVRADAWIPKWKDRSPEEAEEILLHKYLQAYGPATEADFALWCGISKTEARAIWAREQANFSTVDVEGWPATLLRKDIAELNNASIKHPQVRLLPYFDTFLLGHKDRQHLVAIKHQPKVFRPQGWISPTVLVDGHVAGVWKHELGKDRLEIRVETFESPSRNVIAGIQEEAHELGGFLGIRNVEVQIV